MIAIVFIKNTNQFEIIITNIKRDIKSTTRQTPALHLPPHPLHIALVSNRQVLPHHVDLTQHQLSRFRLAMC